LYQFDQKIYINGFSDLRDFDSGFNSGVLNAGETEYVFLAPHPDLYVFHTEGDTLVPVWYQKGVNTNTILVYDFDNNGSAEFYFNTGDQIIGYEKDINTRPLPPYSFEVYPLNEQEISLTWREIAGTDRYIIYRGLQDNTLVPYDSISSASAYIDTNVMMDLRYYYALQAVDFSFENPRSNLNNVLAAVPNAQPFVDTLVVRNQRQLELYFSETMDQSTLTTLNFQITSGENPVTSAIPFINGQAVLLSVSTSLEEGAANQLRLISLRDAEHTPLVHQDSTLDFISNIIVAEKPYISAWEFEGPRLLNIKYSMPMNLQMVSDITNYELEPSGQVTEVATVSESEGIFRLRFSEDTYTAGSGITTYLILHQIENYRGDKVEEGRKIALVVTPENIENIFVYPQPVTRNNDWLMFANLPPGTAIKIFDMNGRYITELKEEDQNGGISWNLTDKSGQKVTSGVYIYHASFDNQIKLGKFTVVR
jgi:hypothetical protein